MERLYTYLSNLCLIQSIELGSFREYGTRNSSGSNELELRRRLCVDRASNPSLQRGPLGERRKTLSCGRGSDPRKWALGNSLLCMGAGGGRLHLHLRRFPKKNPKLGPKDSSRGPGVMAVYNYCKRSYVLCFS